MSRRSPGPRVILFWAVVTTIAIAAVAYSTGQYGDLLLGVLLTAALSLSLLNRRVLWAVRAEQRVQTRNIRSIDLRFENVPRQGIIGASNAPDVATPRLGADHEYARRVKEAGPGLIETYALQNRSESARDVLARAASEGRYGATELSTAIGLALRDPARSRSRALLASLEPRATAALAKVMAQQGLRASDSHDALTLYRALLRAHGSKALDRHNRLTYVELLAQYCDLGELRRSCELLGIARVDPTQVHLLLANAANPFTGPRHHSRDVHDWLDHVNAVFKAERLEPIVLKDGDGAPIDRIICAPSGEVKGGPKVTIIVPTYNPADHIATAVRSVIKQSYRNIEVLVMDDGSPRGARPRIDCLAELDSRIRVVHLDRNAGSYNARNVAVAQYATGELITVHDDDDWSHPRKIELQVRHLIDNPTEPANMSMLSRATPELEFTRINNNPLFTQPNFSSLMVRRVVLDALGFWDLVSRSADAEMRDRIVAWSGRPVSTVGRVPLSFLRVRSSSLTAGEISKGYVDARRMWYQRIYRAHHRKCGRSSTSLRIAREGDRRFAAPVGLLGNRNNGVSPCKVDVLYATDFRFPGGNSSVTAHEIDALVKRGYRVGLLQLDSPLLAPTSPLHERIFQLSSHPNVAVLSILDRIETKLTIVRHPTVLQYVARVRAPIRTNKLVLIANHPPFEPDLTGSVYDIARVVSNAEAVFGHVPVVAPESGTIRELLSGLVDPRIFSDSDWSGIVGSPSGHIRSAYPERPYVMGRHSRDHLHKWPHANDLPLVYPVDGSRDVRVLGGANAASKRLGDAEPKWTVYPFDSKEASDFLQELDFWVYFHGPELMESFGMATAEAMSAGLVVVLPRYMESTFGDGAVYCEPQDVIPLLDQLWRDTSEYSAQSRRALRYAETHFSDRAFLRRLGAYLE